MSLIELNSDCISIITGFLTYEDFYSLRTVTPAIGEPTNTIFPEDIILGLKYNNCDLVKRCIKLYNYDLNRLAMGQKNIKILNILAQNN